MFLKNLNQKLADILRGATPDVSDDFVPDEIPYDKTVRLIREKGWETQTDGVKGRLVFPSGYEIMTLERPWVDNKPEISCIPADMYEVKYRDSDLTKRLTSGKHTKTFQIVDVEGRTNIMIHIGNFIKNSLGCVLVGMSHGRASGEDTVWSSAKAFEIFIEKMLTEEIELIIIETEGE